MPKDNYENNVENPEQQYHIALQANKNIYKKLLL